MRIALNVAGVLFALVGGVWFLQGLNVLLGSVMSGRSLWLFLGLALLIAGVVLLLVANLRKWRRA